MIKLQTSNMNSLQYEFSQLCLGRDDWKSSSIVKASNSSLAKSPNRVVYWPCHPISILYVEVSELAMGEECVSLVP